jgi:iron complex outermembrane receptor protein
VEFESQSDGNLVQEFGPELFVAAAIAITIDDRVTVRFGAGNLFNAYPDEAALEASKGRICSCNAPHDTDVGAYYLRVSTQE